MFTRIHPIVFLRPMIKQEWPAESNDTLQRCQDNLSSAKYLNLAPGGPQSIQTACFDGYIGAPPTRTLLWVPYACNGFPMVSNHFPAKGPHQTLRWLQCPGATRFLHFPGWALKVWWREIVDPRKVTLRSRNASFDMLKPSWPIIRITHPDNYVYMYDLGLSERNLTNSFFSLYDNMLNIDAMFTWIHPIVFLRAMIKQEWPSESNGQLQRCQDNLSLAKYFNLEPGGPQSIHTACFDRYIGAPSTRTLLWFPYACNGFPMVSNHFPAKGPYQTLRWCHRPGATRFLHFPRWALKVRWREIVDFC